MKKTLLVGAVGCGKTTFKQRLFGEQQIYDKTQAIEFYDSLIDTPGEFTEHRRLYSALNVTATQTDLIIMMQSVLDKRQIFSPGFSNMFLKPSIGVITKMDLAQDDDSEYIENQLRLAGTEKIFRISAKTNEGIPELVEYLNDGDKFE